MVQMLPVMPASLTHESAHVYVRDCSLAMSRAEPVSGGVWALDASSLSHFDSAVLAALLAVQRDIRNRGESLQLIAWPERLHNLATLYGVRDLLPA